MPPASLWVNHTPGRLRAHTTPLLSLSSGQSSQVDNKAGSPQVVQVGAAAKASTACETNDLDDPIHLVSPRVHGRIQLDRLPHSALPIHA